MSSNYYNNSSRRENSTKNFLKLRCELAIRENNQHPGSGLGGSSSEFWFMINHHFEVMADNVVSFKEGTSPDEVIAYIPPDEEPNMEGIRNAFSSFVSTHPDKINLSKEDIVNISLLKDLKIKHPNAILFIKALEVGQELASWIDTKIELDREISKLFHKEDKYLQSQFLESMNLPPHYFTEMWKREKSLIKENYNNLNTSDDPNWQMFIKHHIWGVKRKAMQERQKSMQKVLLSQEDKDKMNFLSSCPPFITLQVVRSCVGIRRIVALNLDECWPALDEINKIIR